MAEKLDASAVADLLVELGQRVELSGDSAFKARAYHRAAETLRALTPPLEDIVRQGRLREIPGIGAAIEEKIEAFHRTGTHRTLDRLRSQLPASVLEMLRIPGLTAPKVRQIYDELGIGNIEQLEAACQEGRLAGVKGLGPALQKKILQGIEILRRSSGQRHIHYAGALLAYAAESLAKWRPELSRIVMAGDFRRGCELVHDLSLVAQAQHGGAEIAKERIGGDVDLTTADAARYGPALVMATGSAEHIRQLQARSAALGFTLDEQGLRGTDLISCDTENDLYAALGLPFIEPELREGADELDLAVAGQLPALVAEGDLRGILHAHTDQSDGTFSLEDMAEATRERGFEYFGVADHSQSAGYAGGLSQAEIEAQHAEAERLNKRYRGKFRILKGIESDILVDGSLDYPDDVLARFDFVVASVHSRFALEPDAQTERIVRAACNPFTTVLGHMTGRLLLRREGYEIDVERVLRACAENGVAVEVNANPHRLDLDWRWHRRALELGCMLSINPDAHSIAELDMMRWGVAMARKGGVPKQRVLNCMSLKEITAFFQARRNAREGGAGALVSAGRRGRGRAPGRSGP